MGAGAAKRKRPLILPEVLAHAASRHNTPHGRGDQPSCGRASGVTMREAVRSLPAPDAARLMSAYRAGEAAAVDHLT
jgi:hypothetical protein